MNRLEVLDYLRGVMAFSVMLYHYLTWSTGMHFSSDAILGKLGIYAVSIFFILSGVSLGLVYKSRIKRLEDIKPYLVKRFFRIAPLLWFVTALTLLLIFIGSFLGIDSREVSFYSIFLNFTLLFGFIDTSTYIASGAWSIGNELVFYIILPFILVFNQKYKYSLVFATFISLFIYLYFAFVLIDANGLFLDYWKLYINPFNQLFLFMAGVFIGYYRLRLKTMFQMRGKYYIMIILVLLGIFYFYPSYGDRIALISGWNRMVFTFLCISIVFILSINDKLFEFKRFKFLSYLGLVSYSIYLVHPLVYYPSSYMGKILHLSSGYIVFISIIITLIVSRYVYKYIEYPLMQRSKK